MNQAVNEFKTQVAAKPPEAWYDECTKEYLVKNNDGNWSRRTEHQFKRLLSASGIAAKRAANGDGIALSPQDTVILDLQHNRSVRYAAPLAGHREGVYTYAGARILVTTSPDILVPVAGEWGTIRTILEGMFGADSEQLHHLFGWIKVGYESLRSGRLRQGQALGLCGERRGGKTLTVEHIITPAFGGRAAMPHQFMTGASSFNSDLFTAESLVIDDENSSTDIRARRALGTQIKIITANAMARCHAKNREAITLKPFWRLTILMNDEAENLTVLPPIDDSIEDKLILLKVHRKEMPMPTGTDDEKAAFGARLKSELPAFLHFLTTWDIPTDIRCSRFGVKYYHHPEILEALSLMAPETKLLALIDGAFFNATAADSSPAIPEKRQIETTSEALEQTLIGGGFAYEARRVLSWNNACGTYLGRLAKQRPDRVQQARRADTRMWRISHPNHPFSAHDHIPADPAQSPANQQARLG